ncbi:baseplate J/gp47 family protein [Lentilactobacillus sp. TOM.63]|uniref:baseplate J/gp47 family protein n=1 Tax=Lentilactobacillus sp. TOM.63 TaxID=3055077 RepID=UPI0025A136B3|nr:baseplate J/gp47 family protein [Lentilactobacillus sp. TOM.63]MDM7515216.1 baseplate J/gp47 family protein [Lentilactobacillus sp. TOM.63]
MIDENGYTPLNYDDALDTVQGFIRRENGEDTNVSPRSFWGTLARVMAKIAVNIDQNGENVHDSGYIQQSTGVNLDRVGGNYGLMRKQAEASSVTLSFTGTAGYVIPTGTVFMDDKGNEFYTVDDCQLDVNGVGSTIVVSSELGSQYNVDAGTIVNQQSPVEEIDKVTNHDAAEGGQDMETDLDFRSRLLLASNSNESGTINGIYTALMNTQGVTAVKSVYNSSASKPDVYDNPPKTVHYYVQGGVAQDVVNTIFRVGGGGIALYGSKSGTAIDDSGEAHTIYFDRPQETPIFAKVSVKVNDSFDKNEGTDDIKAAIEGYIESLQMGSKVVTNQFFSNIYSIDGINYADIAIGTDKSKLSTNNIALTAFEIPVITDDNVEVDYVPN